MARKDNQNAKRQLRSSYFTTTVSIALVLFLIGIIGLLALNAQRLSQYVKENIGFTIILNDDAKDIDVKRLQKFLDATNYVKSTEYIDKDRAAKELQEELGEDFIDFLGYNPLLASIDVKLFAEFANPDSITHIEQKFLSFPQVKEIFYQKDLLHLVNENVKNITLILSSFALLLMLIAIALINNTIRLSIYSKRFLINTMQLVGATKSFIRMPFLGKSIFYGFLGSVFALLLLSGIIYLSHNELDGVIGFDNLYIIAFLFAIVIAIGIIISLLSTFFAVNKYLRLKSDELYF